MSFSMYKNTNLNLVFAPNMGLEGKASIQNLTFNIMLFERKK